MRNKPRITKDIPHHQVSDVDSLKIKEPAKAFKEK